MKADDFAAWLSAISRMSEGQRAAALAALEKAGSAAAAEAEVSGKKSGKRGRREDALGTTGVERQRHRYDPQWNEYGGRRRRPRQRDDDGSSQIVGKRGKPDAIECHRAASVIHGGTIA